MKILRVGLVLLLSCCAHAQQPSDANSVAAIVNHLMDVHVGFTKMVPAGWSIEAKEVARDTSQGLTVQYHIFVKGAPAGTVFKALNWPVTADKPSVAMEGITVGKDGILICAGRSEEQCGDPAKPDDPIEFTFMPIKGEPVRLGFTSPAGTIGTVIVPDPVEAKDKGCSLNAVRLTAKFELAFLSGSGYPPNQDIHYRATSSTTSDLVIHSDEKGTIRFSILSTQPRGKVSTTRVKVTEKACSPEVSFETGKL